MSDVSLTYNQKLVIQWKKEHQGIVSLVDKIINEYKANRQDMIKKELDNFYTLVTAHLMSEDEELYKFSMLEESLDEEIRKLIEEFVETFEETKFALMDFLTKYTLPNAVYNQEFIDTFKKLVDALEKRIAYEEKNLYKTLQVK